MQPVSYITEAAADRFWYEKELAEKARPTAMASVDWGAIGLHSIFFCRHCNSTYDTPQEAMKCASRGFERVFNVGEVFAHRQGYTWNDAHDGNERWAELTDRLCLHGKERTYRFVCVVTAITPFTHFSSNAWEVDIDRENPDTFWHRRNTDLHTPEYHYVTFGILNHLDFVERGYATRFLIGSEPIDGVERLDQAEYAWAREQVEQAGLMGATYRETLR